MKMLPVVGYGYFLESPINFFVPNVALIRGRHLFGGGTYSSKYSNDCV